MRTRAVISALFFAFCVDAGAAQTPNRHADASCACIPTTPAQLDVRGTAQSPLIVNATLPLKSASEIARDDQDRAARRRSDNRTWWLGVATAVILLVQVIAFGLQAYRLRQSVALAQATARRQLRGYLFVGSAYINPAVAPGALIEAIAVLKNFGQTPAYKLTVNGGMGMAPSFEELPPAAEEPRPVSSGSLGPGAEYKYSRRAPHRLTEEQCVALATGKVTLFVYGQVDYVDTFGKRRFLRYRLMTGGAAGLRGNELASCGEGNVTDDEPQMEVPRKPRSWPRLPWGTA